MHRASARRRLLLRGGAGTWLRVAGPRDPARPSSMVAAVSLLLVCATLFLSACAASGGSASACGRELPTVEPPQAAPGKNFVLSGGGFGGGCDDSNAPFRPDPPEQDVRIGMRQDGKTWHLATVDADEDYKVEATLKVPNDAEPGRAIVVIPDPNSAEPLKVPFRVLNGPT